MQFIRGSIFVALAVLTLKAQAAPTAPTAPDHPGSKVYPYGFDRHDIKCMGRAVTVYLPKSTNPIEKFPAVVYGHGQALDVSSYAATLEHLAKKGVAAIFPTYDNGFFDQDWTRMGRDYVNVAGCAIDKFNTQVEKTQTVFAGHSKGAYVASIAAGLAAKENMVLRPGAVVLFAAAGFDSASIGGIEPATALTVVFSDKDTVVDRNLSESIYNGARSKYKQFIFVKSYPSLNADHFWPLTKPSTFGGGNESALHYYGAWKWLVAAALDLKAGGAATNPYLYGAEAGDKGVPGTTDDVRRNWNSAVTIDDEVSTFAQSTGDASETFPVLIRYRSTTIALAAQSRAATELALRQQTTALEQAVFRSLPALAKNSLRTLWLVNGSLADLTRSELQRLAHDPRVERIHWAARPHGIDPLPMLALPKSGTSFTYGLEHIQVPQQRTNFPQIDGHEVRVGVIDTGIDPNHRDLKGRLLTFRDFTNKVPSKGPYDDHGHGTHVAGTIAGGASSGQAIGVAPGAKLIIAKVFGSYGGTEEGWLLQAMQWMADPDEDPSTPDFAQLVSNSWGNDADISKMNPEDDVFCQAVTTWLALGIVPVAAAGNDGPRAGTVSIPASCPGAIAVGATDDADRVASFSSRGPVRWMSLTLAKPDIAAPGSDIESAEPGGGYGYKSGTSMATPHVSGAVALLLQANPSLDPAGVLALLVGTATDLDTKGADLNTGAGLINVERATAKALGVN